MSTDMKEVVETKDCINLTKQTEIKGATGTGTELYFKEEQMSNMLEFLELSDRVKSIMKHFNKITRSELYELVRYEEVGNYLINAGADTDKMIQESVKTVLNQVSTLLKSLDAQKINEIMHRHIKSKKKISRNNVISGLLSILMIIITIDGVMSLINRSDEVTPMLVVLTVFGGIMLTAIMGVVTVLQVEIVRKTIVSHNIAEGKSNYYDSDETGDEIDRISYLRRKMADDMNIPKKTRQKLDWIRMELDYTDGLKRLQLYAEVDMIYKNMVDLGYIEYTWGNEV